MWQLLPHYNAMAASILLVRGSMMGASVMQGMHWTRVQIPYVAGAPPFRSSIESGRRLRLRAPHSRSEVQQQLSCPLRWRTCGGASDASHAERSWSSWNDQVPAHASRHRFLEFFRAVNMTYITHTHTHVRRAALDRDIMDEEGSTQAFSSRSASS
jgi:hypothetical protein